MTRAQGNHFFLEELLNYLHDRGLDPRDPFALNKIELPDNLHSLILSRLDQLTEREKTTLRVASIIGRLFRAKWLTGYYPELGDLPRVKSDLDKLDELDITPQDSEPELTYLFKHILTHEVTYESLPFATRARLHEQLAHYLESQITSVFLTESFWLDTLVYHYAHSENRGKEREYLYKAAQSALGVSAFHTAVDYLSRLLTLTPESDAERSALALQLAEAHLRLSDFANARAVVQVAYGAARDDNGRILAHSLLAEILSTKGEHQEAHRILTEIAPLAQTVDNQLTLCRLLTILGLSHWNLGNLDEARAVFEKSLTLARLVGDVSRELIALHRLVTVSAARDELERAEQFLREAYTRAVAVGNRERAMAALTNLGSIADSWGNKAEARECYQQTMTLAHEIGVQYFVALNHLNLATLDIPLGQLDSARQELRQGLTLALRTGSTIWVVTAVQTFADLVYAEGQVDRALALLGLVSHHSAWSSMNQRQLKRTLAGWAMETAIVEASMARGAELDWDKTIEILLQGN